MKRYLLAAIIALSPVSAFAQSQPVATDVSDQGGYGKSLAITAGIVGGIALADLLSGGFLTGPLLVATGFRQAAPAVAASAPRVLSPAIQEARAAGAVVGEMITGATQARDAAARRDVFRVLGLGLGGLIGGWFTSHFAR